jgi:glycosyltransferase involved in cell wall biosynthesis
MNKVRLMLVVEGLARGGAEKQLSLLLKHLDREAFEPLVVSLATGGAWAGPIEALGVPVLEVPRGRHGRLHRLATLIRLTRQFRPDVLQTFLLNDNIYGSLAARLTGVPVLVASRRYDPKLEHRGAADRLNRVLWRWADAIVCNNARAVRHAPAHLADRHVVIPNGIEMPPAPADRAAARRALDLPAAGLLVAGAGRVVPAKNIGLFVSVAEAVVTQRADTHFVWIGGGAGEAEFRRRIRARRLGTRVTLTGERDDVPSALHAADVFLLTSDREGLSNATMEAMAAGVPCVVTDAGGTAELVVDGETGYVCPVGRPEPLVERLTRLLDEPGLRGVLGANGRRRMQSEFSAERMATTTMALYRRLVAAKVQHASAAVVAPAASGAELRR